MRQFWKEMKRLRTELKLFRSQESNEGDNKERLIELVTFYKEKSKEFELRQLSLVDRFDVPDSEKDDLKFGVHNPLNKSLRKYFKALNKDQDLIRLSKELNEILLKGNLLVLILINNEGVKISGYNIKAFLKRPNRYKNQIQNLMLGLWGYEHIYVINDKIMYEMPARSYLNDFPKIPPLVDIWINGLGIIESN